MKLTKRQKEIVELIYTGRIYDITSYLRVSGYCESFKYDKEGIFHNFYNTIKDILPLDTEEDSKRFYRFVADNSNMLFDWTGEYISIKGIKRKLDFSKEQLISKEENSIIDFLIIWQYLKQKGMILELPKAVSDIDLSVFYSWQRQKVQPYPDPDALSAIENISNNFIDKSFLYNQKALLRKIIVDGQSYCQYKLKQNSDMLAICEQYVDVKMLPTPKMGIFIQSRFKTSECRLHNRMDAFLIFAIALSIVMVVIFLLCIKNTQELVYLIRELLDSHL